MIGLAKYFIGRGEETEAHIREALRLSLLAIRARMLWIAFAGYAKLALGGDEEAVAWFVAASRPTGICSRHAFRSRCALALLVGWMSAGRGRAGLALDPTFTVSRFRAGAASDNPTYLARRERIYKMGCAGQASRKDEAAA